MSNKISRELVEVLERSVDVKRLVDKIYFSIDNLEKAAANQPGLQLEVGRLRFQTMIKKSSLKRRLAKITGERGLKIRQKDDIRTEGAVKGKLALDPEVMSIQKKYDTAEAYDLFAESLRETVKERLMAIGIIAKLKNSEMQADIRSAQGEEVVEKMRKKARHARKQFTELEEEDEY
jgi:hypothetical protein